MIYAGTFLSDVWHSATIPRIQYFLTECQILLCHQESKAEDDQKVGHHCGLQYSKLNKIKKETGYWSQTINVDRSICLDLDRSIGNDLIIPIKPVAHSQCHRFYDPQFLWPCLLIHTRNCIHTIQTVFHSDEKELTISDSEAGLIL